MEPASLAPNLNLLRLRVTLRRLVQDVVEVCPTFSPDLFESPRGYLVDELEESLLNYELGPPVYLVVAPLPEEYLSSLEHTI